MFHNDFEHLQGKGISFAMIERAYQLFGKEVTSSTTKDAKKKDNPEFHTLPATGVWKSLMTKGVADWSLNEKFFSIRQKACSVYRYMKAIC